MAGPSSKFTRKKEEEAARSIGISALTMLRWLKIPEFQTAYREAGRAAFGQSIARLQQASTAAVSTLLKIMVDPNAPASTRVRAAEGGRSEHGEGDRPNFRLKDVA